MNSLSHINDSICVDIVFFLLEELIQYRKHILQLYLTIHNIFRQGIFFYCFRIIKNYSYYFKVGTNSENRTSGHVFNPCNLLTMSILAKRYLSRYVHIVLAQLVRLFR
jgi:hypothetical protein